jgi:hypothetical protein
VWCCTLFLLETSQLGLEERELGTDIDLRSLQLRCRPWLLWCGTQRYTLLLPALPRAVCRLRDTRYNSRALHYSRPGYQSVC